MNDDTTQPRRPLTLDEMVAATDAVWQWAWTKLEADLRADDIAPDLINKSLAASFDDYAADRPRLIESLRRLLLGEPPMDDDRDVNPTELPWKRIE